MYIHIYSNEYGICLSLNVKKNQKTGKTIVLGMRFREDFNIFTTTSERGTAQMDIENNFKQGQLNLCKIRYYCLKI